MQAICSKKIKFAQKKYRMVTTQDYFTLNERAQLIRLVRGLNERLGDQLTRQDINTVHRLIHDGITGCEHDNRR